MTDTSDLFWRAYTKALAGLLSNQPFSWPSSILFVASVVNRGVNAGESIPYPLTNHDIHSVGDTLLDPVSPSYVPGGTDTYSQELEAYLFAVKGSTGSGDPSKVNSTFKKWKKAKAQWQNEYNADHKQWTKSKSRLSFPQWCQQNDPMLGSLWTAVTQAVGNYQQACNDYYGIDPQLATARNNISSALGSTPTAGCTMDATDASIVQLTQEMTLQKKDGKNAKPWPTPTEIYQVPVYDLNANYGADMDSIAPNPSSGAPSTSQLTMAEGSSVTWSSFGYSSSTTTEFSIPFISWGNQSSSYTQSRSYFNQDQAANITLTLTGYNVALYNISPGGIWNIDASRIWPNIDTTKHVAETKALANQLLCASGVVMEVQFSGDAQTDFYQDWQSASQSKTGGVTIFGYNFGSSTMNTTQDQSSVHTASYNSDSGVLTVSPGILTNTCTLLGVIAQAVTI